MIHGGPVDLSPLVRTLQSLPSDFGPGGEISAAVAVILAGADPQVLIIKRQVREGDPWSGQIALPGGHREPSDASPLDTARREVKEEVGIDLQGRTILGALAPLGPSNFPSLRVLPIVFKLDEPVPYRPGPEVDRAAWIAFKDLPAARTKRRVETARGSLEVTCFVLPLGILWGFTYRILEDFLAVLGSEA